jgi:hypothetical protein
MGMLQNDKAISLLTASFHERSPLYRHIIFYLPLTNQSNFNRPPQKTFSAQLVFILAGWQKRVVKVQKVLIFNGMSMDLIVSVIFLSELNILSLKL